MKHTSNVGTTKGHRHRQVQPSESGTQFPKALHGGANMAYAIAIKKPANLPYELPRLPWRHRPAASAGASFYRPPLPPWSSHGRNCPLSQHPHLLHQGPQELVKWPSTARSKKIEVDGMALSSHDQFPKTKQCGFLSTSDFGECSSPPKAEEPAEVEEPYTIL